MEKFEPVIAEPEKEIKFKNYFRPAKYLIPAAVFAAVLAAGCDPAATPPGTDDGTDDGTVDDGTGDGTTTTPIFKAPVELALNGALSSVSYYVFQPALADIDGDGDLDVFLGFTAQVPFEVTHIQQAVTFYRNGTVPISRGTPVLNEDSSSLPDWASNDLWNSSISAIGPMFAAVGDIDKDGDLEIIGTANSRYIYSYSSSSMFYMDLLTYNETSASSLSRAYSYQNNLIMAPALVDLDGDGDLDLVMGKAGASFSGPILYDMPSRDVSGSGPVMIQYMLNGGDSSGNAVGDFYPFSPDGTLAVISVSSSASVMPVPSFVDIDGDGDPDMFVTMYSSGGTDLKFYRNSGSHNFTEEAIPADFSILADPAVNYFPAFGDVDGDNDIDIIVGTDEPKLFFIENTTN